jgi:signal transduction histidine kinase
MMRLRRYVAAAGLLALLTGSLLLPSDPLVHMMVPVLGCVIVAGLLAGWPASRRWLPAASTGIAMVSLLVTAAVVATRSTPPASDDMPANSLWILLEPALTTVFVYLPVRWASPRAAMLSGGLAAVATALMVQRFQVFTQWWQYPAGSGLWLIPAVAVGLAAWYLRNLASQRLRAISDARHQQRLDLASDLHDFVAHDVSEIVAQAQAGRAVLSDQDPRVSDVLRRIESAGLRALASMDRTVHMLRDSGGAARAPVGGLADIPALVDRFAEAGAVRTEWRSDVTAQTVPRETAAVAYRVVVEALTNVRRHAVAVSRVVVEVTRVDGELVVMVTDDGHGQSRQGQRTSTGLGLPGLSARVESLGGVLEAGRVSAGWRVAARFALRTNGFSDMER